MKTLIKSGLLSRWLNPYKHSDIIDFKDNQIALNYTRQAKQQLQKRNSQLVAEMQIYFSCVVQKRVIFHDTYKHEIVAINDTLAIALRTVQSDRCDPVTFANNHPIKRELTSKGATQMTAKELFIDYKNNKWIGSFNISSTQ